MSVDPPGDAFEGPRTHSECYACPVGSFFAEFRAAEPEALEHVLNAAYELLEVARVAIEAAERAIDEQRTHAAAAAESARASDAREGPDTRPGGARKRVRRIDIA
jgi:hypothetical protein